MTLPSWFLPIPCDVESIWPLGQLASGKHAMPQTGIWKHASCRTCLVYIAKTLGDLPALTALVHVLLDSHVVLWQEQVVPWHVQDWMR